MATKEDLTAIAEALVAPWHRVHIGRLISVLLRGHMSLPDAPCNIAWAIVHASLVIDTIRGRLLDRLYQQQGHRQLLAAQAFLEHAASAKKIPLCSGWWTMLQTDLLTGSRYKDVLRGEPAAWETLVSTMTVSTTPLQYRVVPVAPHPAIPLRWAVRRLVMLHNLEQASTGTIPATLQDARALIRNLCSHVQHLLVTRRATVEARFAALMERTLTYDAATFHSVLGNVGGSTDGGTGLQTKCEIGSHG